MVHAKLTNSVLRCATIALPRFAASKERRGRVAHSESLSDHDELLQSTTTRTDYKKRRADSGEHTHLGKVLGSW